MAYKIIVCHFSRSSSLPFVESRKIYKFESTNTQFIASDRPTSEVIGIAIFIVLLDDVQWVIDSIKTLDDPKEISIISIVVTTNQQHQKLIDLFSKIKGNEH